MTAPNQISIDDRLFVYKPGPHLRPEDDWHNAYIPIIEAFSIAGSAGEQEPVALPAYPLVSRLPEQDLLFELGSYWEGALYFLHCKISSRDMLATVDRLARVEAIDDAPFMERLFLEVWNSHGQLIWLKAFLIRERALERGHRDGIDWENSESIRRIAPECPDLDIPWLASFVEQHSEEGRRYPNPYFGGLNPLHLGMISLDPRRRVDGFTDG